jgi:hypothetical protein
MKVIAYVIPIVFTVVVIALSGAPRHKILVVLGVYAFVAIIIRLAIAIDEKIQKKKLKVNADDRT